MPRMTVHMFGIMFFSLCKENTKATVLLPDGTEGDGPSIPQHYASFFVDASACEKFSGWRPIRREVPTAAGSSERVTVLEFRIPGFCEIAFPKEETDGTFDPTPLRQGLLHMRDIDENYEADLSGNGSIALANITCGKLEAFTFNRNANAVQWTIRTGENPLKIEAGDKTITLRPNPHNPFGAEIVLANAPDYLTALERNPLSHSHRHADRSGHDDDHHFRLFRKIQKPPSDDPLLFPRHRTNINYNAVAMNAFDKQVNIESSCTPPCCDNDG